MFWKFTFTDPGNNVFSPTEPAGWEDATINLERHSDFHSLIETFTSSFQTYGSNGVQNGGRDWLLSVENTYGADAIIQVLVQIDNNENGNWETLYQGNLGIAMFIESLDIDHFLQIVFAQQDFWSKFIARYTTEVDIRATQNVTQKAQNLPGTITPTPYINLPLPSQKIIKSFKAIQKYNSFIDVFDYNGSNVFKYITTDFDTTILDEIQDRFSYGWTPTEDITPFGFFIVKDSGDLNINFNITLGTPDSSLNSAGPSAGGFYFCNTLPFVINRMQDVSSNYDIIVQINNGALFYATKTPRSVSGGMTMNNGLLLKSLFNTVTDYSFTNLFQSLRKNDTIKIFGKQITGPLSKGYSNAGPVNYSKINIFGSNGINANDFNFNFSGFVPNSNININNQLISSAYNSGGTNFSPDANGLPTTNSRDGISLQIGDTFIVGIPNIIGGIQTEIGWVLQYLGWSGSNAVNITCAKGSTSVTFSNNLYFGSYMFLFDNMNNLIGAISQWNTNTTCTLSSPARISYNGALTLNKNLWYISNVPLLEGMLPYGNTYINIDFSTTSDDLSTGLYIATGTNAYSIAAATITSLLPGISIFVNFQNANTGASTLNVNGLGAKPLIHINGNALVANDIISVLVASGTNTYAASYGFITQLLEGITLTINFTNANTGASTLNVNGLGAKSIYYKGIAIGVGAISSGQTLTLLFDGTFWQIQDNNQQVTGQIYVLNYDGNNFVVSLIAGNNNITPTANKNSQAFLAHDVMGGILDRITDNTGLFYSNYLGNQWTSKTYPSTGCGGLLAILKGLHLRGFTLPQKSFFMSAENWWEGINPIMNLGLGYDVVNGNNVIRVEPKSYFYNPAMIATFPNVQKITRTYDSDHQFNKVDIGYKKWQSQASNGVGTPSGIDDPQATHSYSTLFRIIGKPIQIMSNWIAASLTIESTRRLGIYQSANYTYDDDTFVIALAANGDGTFTPELSQNFSAINNLTNPTTRYNTRLTPARNLLRWIDYLSGCLQSYMSSFFTFSSGTGNYNMQSTATSSCPNDATGVLVSENGNFSPSSTPYFVPQLFEIETYLDWETYLLIRNNRGNAIGISQTNSNFVPFFIKTLNYNIAKGTVKIQAWPQSNFKIQIIDSPATEEIVISTHYYEQPYYDPGFYE